MESQFYFIFYSKTLFAGSRHRFFHWRKNISLLQLGCSLQRQIRSIYLIRCGIPVFCLHSFQRLYGQSDRQGNTLLTAWLTHPVSAFGSMWHFFQSVGTTEFDGQRISRSQWLKIFCRIHPEEVRIHHFHFDRSRLFLQNLTRQLRIIDDPILF